MRSHRPRLGSGKGDIQIPSAASPQPDSSTSPQFSFVVLLLLAVLLYIPMLGAIWSAADGGNPAVTSGEDRIGLAWSEVFALLFGVPLWLVLAGLLRIAARHGQMPKGTAIYAAVLWMLGAAAAWGSALAYFHYRGGWSILVPASLPLLLSGYAAWMQLPMLAALTSPKRASWIGLGAIASVAAAALPLTTLDGVQFPARVATAEKETQAAEARAAAESAALRQSDEAKFRVLGQDSSLADYLPYIADSLDHPPERRDRALAGARLVRSRQDDAVHLLDQDKILSLVDLWQLDLQATPLLCAAYDKALRRFAENPAWYDDSATNLLQLQLPNIDFLARGHCDLDAGLDAAATRMEKALTALGQDDRRTAWQALHDKLVALRQPQ